MQCPFCQENNTKVLESRSTDEDKTIRRRRECLSCTKRFTTYERMELSPVVICKNSGSKEVYSREKLISSIIRSCSKSQLTTLMIDQLVDNVEAVLYKQHSREISSNALGEIVLDELKKADATAYIRYASIFKKFSSINEFIEEIKSLEDSLLGLSFETVTRQELAAIS